MTDTICVSHFLYTRASPRGFEPRSTVLETAILPLNYRPVTTAILAFAPHLETLFYFRTIRVKWAFTHIFE